MLVSTPRGARASSSTARQLALALFALLVLALAPSSALAATPKILKKATVSAPKGGTVRGTLTGSKCLVRLPVNGSKIKVTVRGPLSVKKPKTKTLKTKGKKKVVCTWKTSAFADGTYQFVATARQKIKAKTYKVSLKRTVIVKNKVTASAGMGSTIPGLLAEGPPLGTGNARFVARLLQGWDGWLGGIDSNRRQFVRQHFWGVVAHTPSYDQYLPWSPPTLVYKDLYAIYREDTPTLTNHPEWVLKDAAGNPTFIDWGCQPGPCPQYAGDIGSPTFRANWIAQAKEAVAKGYSGLWIDDANMEIRVGDAAGNATVPVDPRTGQKMTFANWRRYIAEFLEQIRREIPGTQLVANVLWFGGTSIGRDADQFIRRAYTAVDRLNLERGFNDDGLTAGYSPRDAWAVESFMEFIDRMHDLGLPVTLDSAGSGREAWEYNLGGFFLVDQGADAVGEMQLTAGDWWNGWDVRLGPALGERTRRSDGVFERQFAKGLVLLNPTRATPRTIKLPKAYKRIDGSTVTSVTPQRGPRPRC
ncbi:MAG: putative glycoside hydrolase [Patulibacter minatonensis]